MKNFEYYGLFLTEESKTKLKEWLWMNDYDFNNDIINLCANKIPHITICTFNGGKPVDSNNITEWKDI